ncbi:unnamed protein product [Urochloa humidicola]
MVKDPRRTPTSVCEPADAPVCPLESGVLGQKIKRPLNGGSERQSTQDKGSRKASMRYLDVKKWMAYLEDSNILDRFPDISRLFLNILQEMLQETVERLVKQGDLYWPREDKRFSSINEIPAEPLRDALYSLISGDLRNTVTVSLDGTKEEVLESYVLAHAHFVFWFCTFGNMIDFSPLLGYPKILYTTPPDGTFHLIIKFEGRSIDLVVDARDAWKYGIIGDKGFCILNPGDSPRYITLDGVIILRYSGEYKHIAPKGTSQIRLGLEAQRDAFRVVVDLNENTDTDCPEFKAALSTFVFGFLEALKFHRAKQLTCDTISSGLENLRSPLRKVLILH